MRLTILTILTVFFFGAAFLFEYYHKDNYALEQTAALVQKNLQQQETEVEQLAKLYLNENGTNKADKGCSLLYNQGLINKKYSVFLYENDSLLFWSNNKVLAVPDSAGTVQLLDNGYYFVKKIDFNQNLCLVAAIPIKYVYQIDVEYVNKGSDYVENTFVADNDISAFLSVKATGKGSPIFNLNGKQCCEVSFLKENKLSHSNQYLLLLFFILAFLFLAFLVNALSLQLLQNKRGLLAFIFFGLAIFGIKLLSISINLDARLGDVAFFLSSLEPYSFSSIEPSAMLINIILLLWVIVFYYKHIDPIDASHSSTMTKRLFAFTLYIANTCSLMMAIQIHKVIVMSPKLYFDFDNFFYIDVTTVMTIFTVLLVWFALFIFNFKVTRNIQALGFELRERALIYGAVLLLLFVALQYTDRFQQPWLGIISFCILYVSMLDTFSEGKHGSNFSWLFSWLILFAVTTTVLFYSYSRLVDFGHLEEAVNKLAAGKDIIAKTELDDIAQHIKKNVDSVQNRTQLYQIVENVAKKKSYLMDHYTVSLSDSTTFEDKVEARGLPSDEIFGNIDYDVKIPVMIGGSVKYYRLEAIHKDKNLQLGYQEDLFQVPYLKIKGLSKISYSIFHRNTLVKSYGQDYVSNLSEFDLTDFEVDKRTGDKFHTQYFLKLGKESEYIIVGQISYGGLYKMIFLFTYLLVFLFGISFFIFTINTYTRFIDNHFVISLKGALQTKIHQSIVALIVFSSVIIGTISIMYFVDVFDNNNKNYITEKTSAVQYNIQNDLKGEDVNSSNLEKLIAPISQTHQIDINIYDLSGKLLNPDGKNVFQKGILSSMMNAEAFQNISQVGKSSWQGNESIGSFNYEASYGRIVQNQKTVAYFGLPSYKKEWERKNVISDTIGHLLSYYVLLIMAVIIFSYLVARYLLRPLRDIGAKLQLVQLGQKTLDVNWNGADALGDLIREFNVMLQNLRKQAQAGEQTARDEAWQQMAKQIAHDIRNALTPMKLSIQFLEHSMLIPDLNISIKERIQRITATLVEQIGHFNQIATNFGDFAKARTEPSAIEVAELNYFLTLNLESQTIVNIHLPKEKYMVSFDRTQMARVVHNLITNALQAIPENREGRVDIYLFEQDDKAVIRISDNGLGIPDAQMDQIFQPNFTTKNSGTGLGLAICRKLVQDVGGNIYCTSTLHQGSDFYVELPIEEKIEYNPLELDETFED
jgi:two-component system, NtrC family, nitrogen regulation sensor histidine kinase NtrY